MPTWSSLYFLVATASILGSLSNSCKSRADSAVQIIGGRPVKVNDPEFPFVYQSTVFLSHALGNCSGVVISDHHVLTAAHCVNPYMKSSMYVSFGEKESGISRKVIEIVKHEESNSEDSFNDIAVISFADGLPAGFQKAPLAKTTVVAEKKLSVVLGGHGIVLRAGTSVIEDDDFLNAVATELVFDVEAWTSFYQKKAGKRKPLAPPDFNFHLGVLGPKGFASGDSGGPVFLPNGDLIGIDSVGGGNFITTEETKLGSLIFPKDTVVKATIFVQAFPHREFIKRAQAKLTALPKIDGELSADEKRCYAASIDHQGSMSIPRDLEVHLQYLWEQGNSVSATLESEELKPLPAGMDLQLVVDRNGKMVSRKSKASKASAPTIDWTPPKSATGVYRILICRVPVEKSQPVVKLERNVYFEN